MSLPSFLQRLRQRSTPAVADVSPLSSADIEVARVRARRRLVGMVVLVGVGVVGLPWLFETQPRPLGPDVQVVSAVPRGGAPVSPRPAPSIASVTVPVAEEAPPESDKDEAEATAPVANKPAARASAAASASKPAPARAQASQAVAAVVKPAPAKEAAKKEPVKPVAVAENSAAKDAARAKSLLEGKPPAKPASAEAVSTRYVVQIGAFSDLPTAREVRMKAERAGVKTYTQEVTVNGGKKIRVRVGPYANKAEADKAVDTLRKAGMTSALLTL